VDRNGSYPFPIHNSIVGGDSKNFPVKEFLEARLWDGKTFWEAEEQMEWVDG